RLGANDFSLDGIRKALSALGNPQKALACVHIAGSKGKGSTAAFTAEILKQEGYRVGLYTSPHLYDERERIRVLSLNGPQSNDLLYPDCIAKEDFARHLATLKEALQKNPGLSLTYFEALTAVAFLYFKEQKTDIVVLETGLGGRLDATNVVEPLACALTCVDLEHTAILGKTFEAIAREKLGIVKSGCGALVLAPQNEEVRKVALATCSRLSVPCVEVGKDLLISKVAYEDGRVAFSLQLPTASYQCSCGLLGAAQPVNAAVAVGLVEQLARKGFRVTAKAVEDGIVKTFWPGRMEVVGRNPTVVVDGAHTPRSAYLLLESIELHFSGREIVLMLGMSADKDKEAICDVFARRVKAVVVTRSAHHRADPMDDPLIDEIFSRHGMKVERATDVAAALAWAKKNAGPHDVVLAAGSLFLAAEARGIEKGEIR
ncbi:MAG TPA: folylpolyglutamate synthase/dihydrofolate synthase family protein, partial [Candidatus Bathyarchaeia archaeon]|nr:folylpolyglutamate synthase/dihydrofolate synthase family protein [Candidatus Bathyarchaeia archaeon]